MRSRTPLHPTHDFDLAAVLPSRCVRVWVDACSVASWLTPRVPRLQDQVGRERLGWALRVTALSHTLLACECRPEVGLHPFYETSRLEWPFWLTGHSATP